VDRLQATTALALQIGERRTGDQHALHDRFQPQIEFDLRAFRDTEELDAKICRRRNVRVISRWDPGRRPSS
jgi:hypothetical protein